MNHKVRVVIVNYNGKADTLECLASLYRSRGIDPGVILVDNGSSDDSVKAVKAAYPSVAVIENAGNLGFAAGSNQGIRKALEDRAEYIALLNNDAVIDADALALMSEYLSADGSAGAVGPAIFYWGSDNRLWSAGGRIDWIRGVWTNKGDLRYLSGNAYDVDALSGCCLMFPASVLRECGMFDEKLFLYGEDTDLCIRIAKAGRKIVCLPSARVWHKVGRTTGGSDTAAYIYYTVRNRLDFMKRYSHPLVWPVFFCYFLLTAASRYIRLAAAGQPGKSRALVRGTTDFFRNRYGPFRGDGR